jgi:hypothetical protein
MKPQSKLRGITPSALRDNSPNALMSLDFHPKGTSPKRSDRKILERIIPPPSGGRDTLRYTRFQRVSNLASMPIPTSRGLTGLFLFRFKLHYIRSQGESRSLRSWDNSTNRSYCTAFVISESHYSLLILVCACRLARGNLLAGPFFLC